MSATVHTGTGNFSYTNNTGGNIRVIICHVLVADGASGNEMGIKMRFGPPGSAYMFQLQGGSNQQVYGTGKYITGAHQAAGNYAISQAGNSGGFIGANKYGRESMFVSDIWLGNGESIDIQTIDASYPLKSWNILTVPE
tara:strand:+ start:91 stop:507 length:417 start_codon:yes stop_codon:yes gene_type:complete